MSAFNPPKSVPSDVSLAWIEESQTGFGSPALLRGDLWRRFNLVTIPLLSPHEFFTDALAACRDSITGDELAAKLAAKHALRKAELDETLRLLARGPFNPITANRTHIAAARAASHASLASFVRLTAGCSQTEGWGKVDTQSGGGLDQFDYLLPRDDWHRQDYPGGISQTQYPAFEYNIDEPPGQEDETLGKGYERPMQWMGDEPTGAAETTPRRRARTPQP